MLQVHLSQLHVLRASPAIYATRQYSSCLRCNSHTIRQGAVTCDIDAGALTYGPADKDAASKRWVQRVRDIVLIDVPSQPVQPHSRACPEASCPTCPANSSNVPFRSHLNCLLP